MRARLSMGLLATFVLGLGASVAGCGGGITTSGALPDAGHALGLKSLQTLGAYNVDKTKTAVAGISSGGFMAVQLHVAFSGTFHYAAI